MNQIYLPRVLSLVSGLRFSTAASFNALDPNAGWLFKFSATVVVGVAVVACVWKQSRLRTNNARDVGTSREPQVNAWEDPELTCSCGLRARLKISRTSKNSYRLFYTCPKHIFHHQCDFFRWCDEMATTIDSCVDEKNFLHDECVRLQERIDYLRSRREQDRVVWEREKAELRSKLSAVEAELDDIKRGIQQVIESDSMPPFDDSYESDAEYDGAVVIEMVSRP
ncbi:hypothetical protein Nepgr_025457 [Nepenthes gracilis]|uniref:GRF-type domain-containing protein n=1 Tax=Nepenthes gracilis TaxID=150966 RepID=A0AAD3T6X7_NEPGR|nr:hypothetical protein Nepgr_025457 [Nepenthes gracilis]